MTLNKRERGLLFITIGIVVVAGSYFLFRPLTHSYHQLGKGLHERRRELQGYRTTIARQAELQAEYEELRTRLGQQIAFEQMSEVLKKVEEVAAASGVNVTRRQPMVETDRGGYRELPVQCRVEATTDSLVKFLFTLRTGAGFLSVQKLDIFSQPNSNVLRCDILIHALAGQAKAPKT